MLFAYIEVKMKTQKENATETVTLEGQISLEDVLGNVDDGMYGKPSDDFEVQP